MCLVLFLNYLYFYKSRIRQPVSDATNLPESISLHPALNLQADVHLGVVQQLLVLGEHVAVDIGLQVVQAWESNNWHEHWCFIGVSVRRSTLNNVSGSYVI